MENNHIVKKVFKFIINAVAWIILIFALLITVLVFTSDRNNGVANLLGYIPLTVESDSMNPTFSKNDLIISREIDDIKNLNEGDVITFWTIIDGKRVKNTHRIIQVNEHDWNISYVTKGDNNPTEDTIDVYPGDIIGQWTGVKINQFGSAMRFLRTKTGFFICILIPMALFFLFELYKFILVIVEIRRPAAQVLDEEEIKRRAIEEYLAQQKKKEKTAEGSAEK